MVLAEKATLWSRKQKLFGGCNCLKVSKVLVWILSREHTFLCELLETRLAVSPDKASFPLEWGSSHELRHKGQMNGFHIVTLRRKSVTVWKDRTLRALTRQIRHRNTSWSGRYGWIQSSSQNEHLRCELTFLYVLHSAVGALAAHVKLHNCRLWRYHLLILS